jgi:hypothetical protein
MDPVEIRISQTSDVIDVPAEALWALVGPGFADVGGYV